DMSSRARSRRRYGGRSPRQPRATLGGVDRATIDIYEAESASYEAQRNPRHRPQAEALGARVTGLAVDLGSGPGWYTDALGRPAVALDAALAMIRRTREAAPSSLPVQGDLSALPFRSGSRGGG